MPRRPAGPLAGIRVLELGSSVAGPFCGRLFADFGAEVIKVELAEGDPVRSMGKRLEGRSLYAASIFRNKRLVSIDMKSPKGRQLVGDLAAKSDILVENFRPGTLERLGLGYDVLGARNPGLVLVRISGFGQTGPYAQRAGYGAIGEALSGLRGLTGDPDRPPARIAASVTDEVTAIYGAWARCWRSGRERPRAGARSSTPPSTNPPSASSSPTFPPTTSSASSPSAPAPACRTRARTTPIAPATAATST